MRTAVKRSVDWFTQSREHRRYHRLVHRENRHYDEAEARRWNSKMSELPSVWVGSPQKAALVRDGPVMLVDALPDFTGQAVLSFMQRLMDQVGEAQVACEVQKGAEVERQTWALRHFAGHLLPQSEHTAAYRLVAPAILAQTDILAELRSPLADIRQDDAGEPSARVLKLGGAGARTTLRRSPARDGGLWDCVLLGRRKWRLFPPETPHAALAADPGADESLADCFACGPDTTMVQKRYPGFSPAVCMECEQCMGDAVVVPAGWWYQTYDDDRTLSVSAEYGLPGTGGPGVLGDARPRIGVTSAVPAEEPEVIEFELVD